MDLPFEELLNHLLQNGESELVEFKSSNDNPAMFGELVSALANGAVLAEKDEAYLVYGIDDNKQVVGTKFNPQSKHGGQPFINYIASNLKHADKITYRKDTVDGKLVVVVIIPRAKVYPVEFKGVEYIRVDSSKKKLREHPEIARKLWEEILRTSFEDGYASRLISQQTVFELLDFSPYYTLRDATMPESQQAIIDSMVNDHVLVKKLGKFYVTNLGALLFAKDMSKFESLINRGVRLIKYNGSNKTSVERSIDGNKGYALGVNNLLQHTMLLLPSEEYLEGHVRKQRTVFSRKSIRELITNMLIHQDFSIDGYDPRIEIYSDRIEFTNSGMPIIDTHRFLDLNRSRNPKLAKLMRFLGLCEERGMGIDTVEYECESHYLPSPSITSSDGITRVIIFGHKTLRQFSGGDRINLVYMHCCLQYINHKHLTNESLRSRFSDGTLSPTVASRWISEALDANVICVFDPTSSSRKNVSYVPSWSK